MRTSSLFLATYESRHFTFEGCGDSEARAVDCLTQGMRQHGESAGIGPDWWWNDFYASAAECIADGGCHSVREITPGTAYIDGSVIEPPR